MERKGQSTVPNCQIKESFSQDTWTTLFIDWIRKDCVGKSPVPNRAKPRKGKLKTVKSRFLGLSVLLLCVSAFAQTPPAVPNQIFTFPPDFATGFGNLPIAYTTNLLSTPVAVPPYYGSAL